MELVDLVCDGENDLQADRALGSAHSLAQCCPGLSIPELELGDRNPKASWVTVGGSGASQRKHSFEGPPGPGGSQGLGHAEQVR